MHFYHKFNSEFINLHQQNKFHPPMHFIIRLNLTHHYLSHFLIKLNIFNKDLQFID